MKNKLMGFEEFKQPEIISLKDSTLEHISATDYPDVCYAVVDSATALSGCFSNLENLIARNLTHLEPNQVPKLRILNAGNLNIKLSDFPSLKEVWCLSG